MKTKQDVKINFRDYGEITVPKGTRLTHMTASGIDESYHFVDQFNWIKRDYPNIDSLLLHYASHYGINIPLEFVEK